MADNRDFVQGFMNEGGSPVYVEDKKLSEISTKTAIASEGVMLKGTDGAYYEIDKASLSEVIRAELGAILADNSKNNGTSVGKVPTLNSTGNALGASSVADLASVLGVANVRNMTVRYESGVQDASRNPGGSTNYNDHVTIFTSSNHGFEIAYATFDSSGATTKNIYWRQWYNNDPQAWKKIECTII